MGRKKRNIQKQSPQASKTKNKKLKNKKPIQQNLSYVQKQKRKEHIAKYIFSGVMALIIVLIGWVVYEWYDENYKPMHQVVAEVNGTKFDMAYFIDMLTYTSGNYPQFASYFASTALSNIENYELIKQAAETLGYTVTKDEITTQIGNTGSKDNSAIRDAVRASLLTKKLKEDYFIKSVPGSDEQNYVMAMFLESEPQVEDVKDRIKAGESFADIAKELSLNGTTQESSGDLGWLPDGVISKKLGTSVLDDLIPKAELGVLNTIADPDTTKNVGYWLLKVIENNTADVTATVQAILLGSRAEADDVLTKLNAGEDFVTLAEQYSQSWDETNGCELEVTKDSYSDVFEAYALNPEVKIDVVSGIIRDVERSTKGGYWLYEVKDRGIQDISDENKTILINNAFDDWQTALDRTNVVKYLDDAMTSYAVDKITNK